MEGRPMLIETIERRDMFRIPLSAPVLVLFRNGSEANSLGKLRDANRNGAFFYTQSPLEKGSELHLLLLIGSQDVAVQVLCRGEIVRVERCHAIDYPNGIAVRLSELQILDDPVPCC